MQRSKRERRLAGLSLTLGALGFLLVACKTPVPHGQATTVMADSSVTQAPGSTPTADGDSTTTAPLPEWRRAVFEQRWEDAAQAFDVAHPHPSQPLLRFVRARIAAELGEHDRVIDLLNGLEKPLPTFAEEVAQMRAQAAFEVGPFDEAARYYDAQGDAQGKLRAAQSWLRAGELQQAKRAVKQGFRAARNKSLNVKAALRATRAQVRLALGQPRNAASDYRWIVLNAPTAEQGPDALKALRAATPPYVLSKQEHYRRAEAFAGAGRIDDVLAEVEAMRSAPGAGPAPAAVKRALAWGYYTSRRDYAKASELFEESAKLDATHRVQDRFYSARALSRAHQDELAITRYQALIRSYPGSKYAFQARQLIGRLWYALGKWEQSVNAHTAFIERYKRTPRHRTAVASARYERAVALLAMKDARALAAVRRVQKTSTSKREQAMLAHLHSLALLHAGETDAAERGFREVIETRPLSFPALMSAARLRQMGKTPPVPIPGAEPGATPAAVPLQITLPEKVQQLINLGLDIDAEAELADQADSFFSQYAPRKGEAQCQAYGQLSTARLRYRAGLRAIRERAVMSAPTPETEWMWDCIYPRPYAQFVSESEERHGLISGMVHAVMRQESAFHPTVRSPAAAYGLMQVIEPTARRAAEDLGMEYSKRALTTPAFNIELGAYYLGKLLRRFDGHLALAAAGYNAGPGAATRWLQTAGELPLDLFVPRIIYSETRMYVQRVLGNWARYRYLEGGVAAVPELSLSLPTPKQLAADTY